MNTKKLATALVLGALALAPMAQSSQAVTTSSDLSASQVAALTPTQPMKGRAWIQGVVKDQFGHPLGNVDVEAVSNRASGSAITYEKPGVAGSTGFYRIYDLKPGTYTLTFNSNHPKIKPATASVTVKKRDIGQVNMSVDRILADTKMSGDLVDASITPTQKGKVDVTVSTKATKKPTGDVEVRDGNKVVGSDTLGAGDKGSLTITLKKLAKGTYDLKAYFLGSSTLKASASKAFTLTVKKARHRPNAW